MLELMHLIDLFTAGDATDADNSSVKVCLDPMLLYLVSFPYTWQENLVSKAENESSQNSIVINVS